MDVERFLAQERPYQEELEELLRRLEADVASQLSLAEARRFYYLYQRASAALARLPTVSADPAARAWLESLVARSYAELHAAPVRGQRVNPLRVFLRGFPRAVRRRWRALALSLAVTWLGMMFGGVAVAVDPGAKPVLMPFSHLQGNPRDRVAEEEAGADPRLEGAKTRFAAELMTHNIRVGMTALALGVTYGVGTLTVLFYNGVILGGVCVDYLRAGVGAFLVGWLLPHGSVEIPAILLAGQAGLVLAGALIGWGKPLTLRRRLQAVGPDLTLIIVGVAVLLIWAGVVESFFSQYHEPVLPYAVKILFGSLQFCLLILFLARGGQGAQAGEGGARSPRGAVSLETLNLEATPGGSTGSSRIGQRGGRP